MLSIGESSDLKINQDNGVSYTSQNVTYEDGTKVLASDEIRPGYSYSMEQIDY